MGENNVTLMHFYSEKELKVKAYDFLASKDKGSGLSVDAETTLFEFLEYVMKGA